ncbi:MAG TPA: adenine phosphoribosyltransferase [Chloroflexi bacterium]|nr:adenine phosphoribosyltransferase [Chloroflexota bacterium]
MSTFRSTYPVEVAGLYRELPLFEVQPGLRIAVLNILGDTELVQACAEALAEKLSHFTYDVIATAEAKSIPLAYALSIVTQKPYVVLRKHYRTYMGETIQAETISITTGQPQSLYLDEKDLGILQNRNVVLLDDVISTGSTLEGMQQVMEKANAKVVAETAVFTEGDREKWAHIISLGHLPLFTD